jgi:subtilisin family serine protease
MTMHPPRSRLRSHLRWTTAGLLILGAGIASTAFGQAGPRGLPPLIGATAATAIRDQYIVVFEPSTSTNELLAAKDLARSQGAKIGFTYTAALRGFSVTAPPQTVDKLRAIAGVSYIEADSVYSASIIQTGAPTGLDRIDRRLLPLNTFFTYSHTGTGVHAYVIDSGIRDTHTELFPRASGAGFTAITDAFGTGDCNGHGTHVAGTLGGTTYGVAKNVNLHSVRVLDCAGNGTLAGVISGVDWVTLNAIQPAVANMSLGGGFSPTLNTSVTNSIASGVTYAVAAGNSEINACTVSPASTPTAITVGNVDPANDTRFVPSNFGPCLDLFAPGKDILSAGIASDTSTAIKTGTSMASPHVAGVAALYLQTHPAASPATVWGAILNAADVSTTLGWPGVINPGVGSPNVLLHWGSLNDGYDDGDPHLTTVGGVHYDFQSAGEFVLLRDGNGTQIQTRQSPVETNSSTVTNAYTGLTSCVSINTAVAARVGSHRISYVPNVSGVPDPSGLQLRVDGVLTTLGSGGLSLGAGGHIASHATGGINVTFPDGTTMIATPNWWPTQSRWYLNISVFHTPANEGLLGALATGSWLPALPDGSSLGPRPTPLHQRYVDLNGTFADAWRVTGATSLFDYAPGSSTSTFTIPSWPPQSGPCVIPDSGVEPVKPLDPATAQQACAVISDRNRRIACIADVQATGEIGFANAHQISELVIIGGTRTRLDAAKLVTAPREEARFTATVQRHASTGPAAVPTGNVQFTLDGRDVGAPVKLDGKGDAVWRTAELQAGVHTIGARYLAPQGSSFFESSALAVTHTVRSAER